MTDIPKRPIDEVREREANIGVRYRKAFEPYRLIAENLVDLTSDVLDDLPEEAEPGAEQAVALILARLATEALAVFHLLDAGYPVQAYTVVGTMLELMHTGVYIGGDNGRAREYFQHTERTKAYPGSVRSTIKAVGKELGVPEESVNREYETFYNQMCLVKHGNPMAMGLGTVADEESLYVFIGPVFTSDSVRLGFATAQQAVRYLLLMLTAFVRHHRAVEKEGTLYTGLTEVSEKWQSLNERANETLERMSGGRDLRSSL